MDKALLLFSIVCWSEGYTSFVQKKREAPYLSSLGKSCYFDRDCDYSMECSRNILKCVCRPGLVAIEGHCSNQPLHSLPPQRFYRYHRYAPEVDNPTEIYSQPPYVHTGQIPNPIHSRPPISDQPAIPDNFHFTYADRKSAGIPHLYGRSCYSSNDCVLSHLHCNPYYKTCDCIPGYELDGTDCVKHTTVELRPGVQSYKQTLNIQRSIKHGNPCHRDTDCYHEGLVCHRHFYKCICSHDYNLDGEYCVQFEGGESPTLFIPSSPQQLPSLLHYNPSAQTLQFQPSDYVPSQYYQTKKRQVPQQSPFLFQGDLGAFCLSDNGCQTLHSHCYQQRCICASGFIDGFGICTAKYDHLEQACTESFPCDTENSACDLKTNRCVCIRNFARYNQSCVAEGETNGFCSNHACKQKDLICDRSKSKCFLPTEDND